MLLVHQGSCRKQYRIHKPKGVFIPLVSCHVPQRGIPRFDALLFVPSTGVTVSVPHLKLPHGIWLLPVFVAVAGRKGLRGGVPSTDAKDPRVNHLLRGA